LLGVWTLAAPLVVGIPVAVVLYFYGVPGVLLAPAALAVSFASVLGSLRCAVSLSTALVSARRLGVYANPGFLRAFRRASYMASLLSSASAALVIVYVLSGAHVLPASAAIAASAASIAMAQGAATASAWRQLRRAAGAHRI